MEMLICQACGAILRGKTRGCNTCGAVISKFSPTALPVITQGSQPLTVNVNPDPLVLERVVAKRQMTALLERGGNGNGNGNGHGNGHGNGNGDSLSSWMTPTPKPAEPTEPTEISFAAPAAAPPQPEMPTPGTPFAFATPPSAPTLVPTPEPAPPAVEPQTPMLPANPFTAALPPAPTAPEDQAPAAPLPGSEAPAANPAPAAIPAALQMFAGAAGVGAGIAAVNAALSGLANAQQAVENAPAAQAPPEVPAAPPVTSPPATDAAPASPAADFFGGAPPQSAEAAQPAPEPAAAAPAAPSPAPGVFDFFGAAVANQVAQAPDAPPQPASKPDSPSEYELSDRADFFAQPKANNASSQDEVTAPPVSGEASSSAPAGGGPPPPSSASDHVSPPTSAPAADPGSLDFFASAAPTAARSDAFPFEEAAKRGKEKLVEDFFPDESHLRKKAEDEDSDKPKINKPLGFTPGKAKDAQEKSSEKEHDGSDDDDDDDDESSSRSHMAVPPRRKFSDKNSIKTPSAKKEKKRDPESEDDDEGNFLTKQVNFFGLSMSRQNQIMLASILAFAGITTFCMVGNAVMNAGGMFAPLTQMMGPQTPALTMTGRWKINCLFKGSKIPGFIMMSQKDSQIGGQGTDTKGDFDFAGTFQGDRIQFNKCYRIWDPNKNQMIPDKPIIFSGKITPLDNSIYIKGVWVAERGVGQFLHRRIEKFSGEWEAQWIEPLMTADGKPLDSQNIPSVRPTGMQMPGGPGDVQKLFTYAAFGFLGLGVIILFASLKIFGPGGAMNVWEKQKYIPGQFKPQHNKMVNELSKPLKPGGLPLGRRLEWAPYKFWEAKTLAMPPEMRQSDPHMLVLGAGDKGKSRLIASMITHDIESNERAVVLIDSDGGLVELITRWVSSHPKGKEMAKRVIVLDPTHKGNSLGYNPLEMPDDGDLQSAASSLVYGFKAIYTEPPGAQSQWNAQTANILRNSALLLMANGKTLTDLPTLLNDNDFRDVMLEAVEKKKGERAEYITLIDTWGQYKKLARTDQWINWVEPILNRVSPMLGDSRIRSILTKPVGDIKLKKLIEEKKVLLVKVAKGQLDENANLLGSLIVTGVKQAALACANNPAKQNPVGLYLDEFDKFIEKETMDSIANETDKFKIAFIGAIKTLQHLPEDFRNQLVINVGTMCCFALAKKDGDMLGPQMFRVDGRKIKHQTLQNFFNKVNTSPQFELISDEEKLNIDRVVGQESRTFFCYRVGTVAGVFHLKSHDFNDVPDNQVKQKLIDRMRGIQSATDKEKKEKESAA